MADNEGKLSEAERRTVSEYLDKKGARVACPSCGMADGWELGTHLAQLSGHGLAVGTSRFAYPAVVLICTTCGFIRFHSAIQVGVVTITKDGRQLLSSGEAVTRG